MQNNNAGRVDNFSLRQAQDVVNPILQTNYPLGNYKRKTGQMPGFAIVTIALTWNGSANYKQIFLPLLSVKTKQLLFT